MKRVRAACIQQTLVFSQKENSGLNHGQIVRLNQEEAAIYKASLERAHTRHQILSETTEQDGSIVLKIRKQYNDKVDVGEYFD